RAERTGARLHPSSVTRADEHLGRALALHAERHDPDVRVARRQLVEDEAFFDGAGQRRLTDARGSRMVEPLLPAVLHEWLPGLREPSSLVRDPRGRHARREERDEETDR